MGTIFFQVDSFAKARFQGNPAGVCLLSGKKEAAWMQNVAAEVNASETAFVRRRPDGSFELRWFSPSCEVDLCGHATLAAAHALWETGLLEEDEAAQFNTRSGLLTAARKNDWIRLDFPAIPSEPVKSAKTLERALGVAAVAVTKHRLGTLVEVESSEIVRNAEPKLPALAKVAGDLHIVTAKSGGPEFDFACRRLSVGEWSSCGCGVIAWNWKVGRSPLSAAKSFEGFQPVTARTDR
jgi:PhzF family phenazine biosynthesis protein